MGSAESKSPPPPPPPPPPSEFEKPWRTINWSTKKLLKSELREIPLNCPELSHFRILLYGQVGAGKSCFINSVQSVFQAKIAIKAEEETSAGKSCTKKFKTYKITDVKGAALPFVLNDVMGLEGSEENGIHPDDIIKALKGHVKEGYTFNPVSPLSTNSPDYIKEPSHNDKVHCLVTVVAADTISQLSKEALQKMTRVRNEAVLLGIPHVVLMTKIDKICPLVKEDPNKVYTSRKIKEKMEECSQKLGPPLKCVFPVSNYHEESETNDKKDVLILMALEGIADIVQNYFENDNQQLV
ncbi:interferon-induced protein 44-like isoform X2 [Silurus meridionalis]|uniref:interferon-induced protein 44-like isoform X2 n=1 Tax=Silurus meridionalis TaxID=175797 RepID=UPI001EEAE75D|nr:interferon-induced protein 44-like isoform X2 [Silurus meridionalis]